jgi:hypothetical protein
MQGARHPLDHWTAARGIHPTLTLEFDGLSLAEGLPMRSASGGGSSPRLDRSPQPADSVIGVDLIRFFITLS